MTKINTELLMNASSVAAPLNYDGLMASDVVTDLLNAQQIERNDVENAIQAIKGFESPRLKTAFLRQLGTIYSSGMDFYFSTLMEDENIDAAIKQIYFSLDSSYWCALITTLGIDSVLPEGSRKILNTYKEKKNVSDHIPFNSENIEGLMKQVTDALSVHHFITEVNQVKDLVSFKQYANGNLEISAPFNAFEKTNESVYYALYRWAHVLVAQTHEEFWVSRLTSCSVRRKESWNINGLFFKDGNYKKYTLKLSKPIAEKFKELTGLEVEVHSNATA